MSSSSESEDELEAAIRHQRDLLQMGKMWTDLAKLAVRAEESTNPGNRQPFPIQEIKGRQWLEILMGDETKCHDNLRMRPAAFVCLHDTLVKHYGLLGTQQCSALEALGMLVWACGHGESVRDMRSRFDRSLDTVSRKFHHALDAMFRMAQDVVRPTSAYTRARHPRLNRYAPWFDGCAGALDGTHIRVIVPRDVHDYWINRKGYTSQNVLAICDLDMRFTYVGAGKSGATHDSRVLEVCKGKAGFPFPGPGMSRICRCDGMHINFGLQLKLHCVVCMVCR